MPNIVGLFNAKVSLLASIYIANNNHLWRNNYNILDNLYRITKCVLKIIELVLQFISIPSNKLHGPLQSNPSQT